jgi:NAD-dependent dihydropyrimidine dehydrogenase PreA subunit
MPKRKIIRIDESKCNGCGKCISACAEGALQLVNGKAKLVKDIYCDGFGDCLGECPTGALTIEEREAGDFDMAATRQYVAQTGGGAAVQRLEDAARAHAAREHAAPHAGGGCPGSRVRMADNSGAPSQPTGAGGPAQAIPSELRQWPIQIHLVPPQAPFFKNKELVVMSTCAPLASADMHWRFLRGRAVVVGCPKLDRTEGYAEKLAAILSEPTIPKVIVVRMEVPCCGGLTAIARQAVALTKRSDLELVEITVGINGDVRA